MLHYDNRSFIRNPHQLPKCKHVSLPTFSFLNYWGFGVFGFSRITFLISARFSQSFHFKVPKVLKRSDDGQEWVLDACPRLASYKFFFVSLQDEDDLNEDDYDGIIRSITLELPSLEKIQLENTHTLKRCTLTCPMLVAIEFMDCGRMVPLKFDGGAQLHRFESESRLSSSYIADHMKQVILCVCIWFII